MEKIKIPSWVVQLIYLLTLLTLMLNIVSPVYARHIFFLSTLLAIIFWLLERKPLNKSTWLLLLPIMAFGAYRIVCTFIESGVWHSNVNAWQVYIATSNRLIMGSALVGFLLTQRRVSMQKFLAPALFIAISLCFLDALYAKFFLHAVRADFAHQRQTLIAYEAVSVYLVFLGLSFQTNNSINISKFLSNCLACAMVASIVLLTETRAACLALLCGVPLIFLFSKTPHKWRIFSVLLAIFSLVILALYPITIKPRINVISSEVINYQSGANRSSSIGARIEMWRASLMVAKQAPFLGAGLLGRQRIIQQEIKLGKLDPIIDSFAKIHLHNEYLDELSLRGILGLGLLLLIYVSLAFAVFKTKQKNLALLALVFSYAFCGLTDVLFFSRETSILFMILLALILQQRQSAMLENQPSDRPLAVN